MDLQLKDKRALVSASSSGIGYSIALRLAREGAEVILNGRSEATVQQALERARAEAPDVEDSVNRRSSEDRIQKISPRSFADGWVMCR